MKGQPKREYAYFSSDPNFRPTHETTKQKIKRTLLQARIRKGENITLSFPMSTTSDMNNYKTLDFDFNGTVHKHYLYPRYMRILSNPSSLVCKRWKDSFWFFVQDVEPTYVEGKVLVLKDERRVFGPRSFFWTTRATSTVLYQRNTPNIKRNKSIIPTQIGNKRMYFSLKGAADYLNISSSAVSSRYYRGWSKEELLLSIPRNTILIEFKGHKLTKREWVFVTGIQLLKQRKKNQIKNGVVEKTLTTFNRLKSNPNYDEYKKRFDKWMHVLKTESDTKIWNYIRDAHIEFNRTELKPRKLLNRYSHYILKRMIKD